MCIGENIQRTKDAVLATALKKIAPLKVNEEKKKTALLYLQSELQDLTIDYRNHTTQTQIFTEHGKEYHSHAKLIKLR